MAEETYNTNKGMNYSFTPTLMEIEKTISLPMLSRKFRRIQFLFCHFARLSKSRSGLSASKHLSEQ